jgi:hypothetical protein
MLLKHVHWVVWCVLACTCAQARARSRGLLLSALYGQACGQAVQGFVMLVVVYGGRNYVLQVHGVSFTDLHAWLHVGYALSLSCMHALLHCPLLC